MDHSQLKHLALCVAVLVLWGCGTASKTTEPAKPNTTNIPSVIGDAAPGDRVPLPPNSGLGMDYVVVDRIYIAASGRQCRRLRTVDGMPIQRVACKGSDGVWSLARDLRPISALDSTNYDASVTGSTVINTGEVFTQPLVPSAGSIMLLNEDPSLSNNSTSADSVEVLVTGAAELLMQADVNTAPVATVESAVQPDDAQLVIIPAEYSTPGEIEPIDVSGSQVSLQTSAVPMVISLEQYTDHSGETVWDEEYVQTSAQVGDEPVSLGAAQLAGETVKRTVNVNETLWSFAKRTTGNALNWKTIAQINGISNAKSLATGTQLMIPVELVGRGD